MTAVTCAVVIWLVLSIGVLLIPSLARAVGVIVVILLALGLAAHGADIRAYGHEIVITGPIKTGDDTIFAYSLTSETRTVYLNSPGGKITASLRIGMLVRQKRLETVAGWGPCLSGAAFIWLGGVPRRMWSGGRIGLHAAERETEAEAGLRIRDDESTDYLVRYMRWLGDVPESVIAMVTQTEPTDMRYVDLSRRT